MIQRMINSLSDILPYMIDKYFYDQEEKEGIKWSKECLSIDNELIPVHALNTGKQVNSGTKKALIYFPSYRVARAPFRSHEKFFDNMLQNETWRPISKNNITIDYKCRSGELIMVQDLIVTPLVLLCVKQKYLFTIDKRNPNPDHFLIVINQKFAQGDDHSNFFRAFRKYYLDEASKFVDVLYTKDIHRLCYTPIEIKQLPAKNIQEQKANMLAFHNLVLQEAITTL